MLILDEWADTVELPPIPDWLWEHVEIVEVEAPPGGWGRSLAGGIGLLLR